MYSFVIKLRRFLPLLRALRRDAAPTQENTDTSGVSFIHHTSDDLGKITFRSVMGTGEGEQLSKKSYPVGPDGKKLKPCCACPETKRARDTCVVEKGEENCTELIEAHKACMRSMGFNI